MLPRVTSTVSTIQTAELCVSTSSDLRDAWMRRNQAGRSKPKRQKPVRQIPTPGQSDTQTPWISEKTLRLWKQGFSSFAFVQGDVFYIFVCRAVLGPAGGPTNLAVQ